LYVAAIASGVRKTRRCRAAEREYVAWKRLSSDERRQRETDRAPSPQRAEAPQRAPGVGRDRPPISPECEQPIAEWRRERDFVKKGKLYDRMPTACQRSVTITISDP
jgi:hypothetical protein